ncbi:MAG: P-type conjugative transfer protein TrbJ [Pseudomonadota bacterium]
MRKATILACALAISLISGMPNTAKASGIPVIDAANLTQNTVDALESVTQTIKQIEQYILQLQQYEDQVKNTVAPYAYVWAKAEETMAAAYSLQNTVNACVNTTGSLDTYLEKYKNLNTYRSSPYFDRMSGGTDEQAAALMEGEEKGSELQKAANDAAFQALQQQGEAIQTDAATLQTIQSNAATAGGRMEAIQYTNQLSAQQSSQLLQLRSQLVAMQTAEAVRAQTVSDREAKQMAVRETLLESRYEASEVIEWKIQ